MDSINERRYRDALSRGATDLFLTPRFEGSKRCWLHYVDGVLQKQELGFDKSALKNSGIKYRLWKPGERLMGLDHETDVWVRAALVSFRGQPYLICRGIHILRDGEIVPHSSSPQVQRHVLYKKGFLTDLALCSWLSAVGQAKDGSCITRKLPRTKSQAHDALQARIDELNEVLRGRRDFYWKQPSLYASAKKHQFGGRRLPVNKVTGVRIVAALVETGLVVCGVTL